MTIHMSPTRAFNFDKNPLRALEDYQGKTKWWEGDNTALLYGNIVHNLAEGRYPMQGFSKDEKKQLISSTGKTKGQVKANFKEAILVGERLRSYVVGISNGGQAKFEVSFKEPDEIRKSECSISYNLTGRADMVTNNAIYDFKTVGTTDFDGFLKYGSFRDHREKNYMMQVTLYQAMFDKEEAHILYIKKDKECPFIYDYKLSRADIAESLQGIDDLISEAVEIVAGKKPAKAVNDGSQWAYKHFGGVINDNQTITF